MQTVTAIGLDVAKSVFQVHCVDADGQVVICRQLKLAMYWRSSKDSAVPGRHRGLCLVAPSWSR
jgi:hypothetical protein